MSEYRVVIEDGIAVVTDAEGALISFDEFLLVLQALKKARTRYRIREVAGSLQACQQSAAWVFPSTRHDIRTSGGCVYFIRCSAQPGKIKIGFTNNLSGRTSTFAKEYGAEIEVLAFAQTYQYKLYEESLHLHFADYRFGTSEWFDETPVLEYLRGLMP